MEDNLRAKIETYQPSTDSVHRLDEARIVVLSGITSAGKDTIAHEIIRLDHGFEKNTTSTTRPPRDNSGSPEQDGIDYFFISEQEALEKMERSEFLEVASVHDKFFYGSPVAEYERIKNDGKTILSVLDIQGVDKLRGLDLKNLTTFFIVPPDFATWLARLTSRSGGSLDVSDEKFIDRLKSARRELEHADNDPRFIPVLNESSVDTAHDIIYLVKNRIQPSDAEVDKAYQAIAELRSSIARYLGQIAFKNN